MQKERLTFPNLYILGDAPAAAAAPSGSEARDIERPPAPPGAGGALLSMMFGEDRGAEQGGSAGARRPSGGESPAIQQQRQKTTHAADIVDATLAANLAKNPYQPPPREARGKCHTAQFGKWVYRRHTQRRCKYRPTSSLYLSAT